MANLSAAPPYLSCTSCCRPWQVFISGGGGSLLGIPGYLGAARQHRLFKLLWLLGCLAAARQLRPLATRVDCFTSCWHQALQMLCMRMMTCIGAWATASVVSSFVLWLSEAYHGGMGRGAQRGAAMVACEYETVRVVHVSIGPYVFVGSWRTP